jgi:hypothetical protein
VFPESKNKTLMMMMIIINRHVRRNMNQCSEKFGIKNLCSEKCFKYTLDKIIVPEV